MKRHAFETVGSFALVGLLALGWCAGVVEAAATIQLPGMKPDEIASAVKLATIPTAESSTFMLTLLNPDQPHKGTIDRYELSSVSSGSVSSGSGAAGGKWSVMAVEKIGTKTSVANISLRDGAVEFQWDAKLNRALAGGLRNCSVNIATASGVQRIHLREPQRLEAAVLDFRKDFLTLPIKPEDLPDEQGLKLQVLNLASGPESNSIDRGVKSFKEPSFLVLKPTEPDVPGARLRVFLMKNGSQLNVLVRPELTPARPDSFGGKPLAIAAIGATPNPLSTKAASSKSTLQPIGSTRANEPTANANEPTILFTTRKLAESKSAINDQLIKCKQGIVLDQQQIAVRQKELDSFPAVIVGTVAEINAVRAKITRLQNEIATFNRDIQRLQAMIPEFEKQLAAFPPLEDLGKSMQLRTKLSLRIYYTVDKQEVDLLVVGGAAATK